MSRNFSHRKVFIFNPYGKTVSYLNMVTKYNVLFMYSYKKVSGK